MSLTQTSARRGYPAGSTRVQWRSSSSKWYGRGALWLTLICALQVALANRPGLNNNPFEDEATYVYIGHRMIQHLLHGAFVTEYPGKYFSGAPALYPVLAALGDTVGGLAGVRSVSLIFAVLATVAVYGLSRELFGVRAGVLGAAAFSLCGPVLFQSHFATIDAMAMSLFSGAAWLAVYSAKRDALLWAPVAAVLLSLAFLTKYGTGAFALVIAALAVAVAAQQARVTVAFRSLYMLLGAAILSFFLIALWGSDIVGGLVSTTSSRVVLDPLSRGTIAHQVVAWIGPWLALALVAALLRRRNWRIGVVLLVGAAVVPLQQLRIGEGESLSKHLAFGMVFASPLIGDLLSRLSHKRLSGQVLTAITLILLALSGVRYSQQFGTTWVDDRDLVPVLKHYIALEPNMNILGEQPAPQHYALETTTRPAEWADTYKFYYGGVEDAPAYVKAIQESHFGLIYLNLQTVTGRSLHDYLTGTRTPYTLANQVTRYLHSESVGKWLVYIPRVIARPSPPQAASADVPAEDKVVNMLVKQFAYSTDVTQRALLLAQIHRIAAPAP